MDRMTTTSTMVSRIEPAPAQIGAAEVIVSSVRSQADRERFIDFQLTLNADDPNFIRPIIVERRDFIDPKKNPLLSHAELELFLATRDGEVVGRIAAINDPNYNQFHNTETGFFGMFESIDDRRVAAALLDAASKWVRGKGMKQIMGPVN